MQVVLRIQKAVEHAPRHYVVSRSLRVIAIIESGTWPVWQRGIWSSLQLSVSCCVSSWTASFLETKTMETLPTPAFQNFCAFLTTCADCLDTSEKTSKKKREGHILCYLTSALVLCTIIQFRTHTLLIVAQPRNFKPCRKPEVSLLSS
jgi:hypothetical protein